jgi:hypothetical protein
MTISRTRFYKWLNAYAIFKEGTTPDEGRDLQGRWMVIKSKQNIDNNKNSSNESTAPTRSDDELF